MRVRIKRSENIISYWWYNNYKGVIFDVDIDPKKENYYIVKDTEYNREKTKYDTDRENPTGLPIEIRDCDNLRKEKFENLIK